MIPDTASPSATCCKQPRESYRIGDKVTKSLS